MRYHALDLRSRLALSPLALALGAAACAQILGIDDRPLRPEVTVLPDAATDAPADPCVHALPPPAPAQDDGAESLPPFYLAMRTLEFVPGGDRVGFDLDGVCTCEPRPNSRADGGSTCVAKASDCDDDGGVDNRAAAFFETFVSSIDIDELSAVSAAASAGERTLIMQVTDYNGTPNDPSVGLGFMPSLGILDGAGCGTVVGEGGVPKAPAGWCGRDRWSYPGAQIILGSKDPLVRLKGWVTDGRLAFESETPIVILVGKTPLTFGAPKGAGRLVKGSDDVWRLTDATFAGRVPIAELLTAVGMLPGTKSADGGRKGLCETGNFGTMKQLLCAQPDIRAATTSDLQGAPCDALSAAVVLTAEQAAIGEEYTPALEDNPCAPDRVDAGLYECQ